MERNQKLPWFSVFEVDQEGTPGYGKDSPYGKLIFLRVVEAPILDEAVDQVADAGDEYGFNSPAEAWVSTDAGIHYIIRPAEGFERTKHLHQKTLTGLGEGKANQMMTETNREQIRRMFESVRQERLAAAPGEKGFRISYETWDDESLAAGETDDKGWYDEEGISCLPDEWDQEEGLDAVDMAIKFLKDNGARCSSSGYHQGMYWYTDDEDYRTGEVTNYHYHPYGFNENELREIFYAVKTGQPRGEYVPEVRVPDDAHRKLKNLYERSVDQSTVDQLNKIYRQSRLTKRWLLG